MVRKRGVELSVLDHHDHCPSAELTTISALQITVEKSDDVSCIPAALVKPDTKPDSLIPSKSGST